jgi:hypothetical protein
MKLVFYRIAKERKFLRGKVVWASKNHFQKASFKTHFQPVQSSFLHYEPVFYSVPKEGNFVRRKASCCLQLLLSDYANFTTRRSVNCGQGDRMKFRMTKILRFWVDVEYERIRNQDSSRTRAQLIPQILREFEVAGEAMRYLDADGRLAWKATPGMLSRLADAEQEAIDDMEDWP